VSTRRTRSPLIFTDKFPDSIFKLSVDADQIYFKNQTPAPGKVHPTHLPLHEVLALVIDSFTSATERHIEVRPLRSVMLRTFPSASYPISPVGWRWLGGVRCFSKRTAAARARGCREPPRSDDDAGRRACIHHSTRVKEGLVDCVYPLVKCRSPMCRSFC
jgi:hypothetical protein